MVIIGTLWSQCENKVFFPLGYDGDDDLKEKKPMDTTTVNAELTYTFEDGEEIIHKLGVQ